VLREKRIANTDIVISVCHGDITYERSDAIVCPANNFLQFHGGVAACILRRAGKCIRE
jgi:O-acetyl-ADP-ribose deacetylase